MGVGDAGESLLGPDGVAALFWSFADAGFDHQGVGECAEEGDGDEGPDFEGGTAGGGVWAGGVPNEGESRGPRCGLCKARVL